MNDVDLPDLKAKLWTSMRADLVQYVPYFAHTMELLCPVCCRSIPYDDFSIEHILPQQFVKLDPEEVRSAIGKNERSGLTLLCRRSLVIKGRSYPNGCNGWKGRYFDTPLREMLKEGPSSSRLSDTHLIALLTVGYLGLFRRYGYRVALTESGLILRNQFFNPKRFTRELPITSQMVLSGEPLTQYGPETHAYWSSPVSVYVKGIKATAVIRNYSVTLTLSYDPTLPLAKSLAYAPRKHVFRPDLRLAFA